MDDAAWKVDSQSPASALEYFVSVARESDFAVCIPSAIETVVVGPALESLLAVQKQYLQSLVVYLEVIVV
jgi:hypothetical protein